MQIVEKITAKINQIIVGASLVILGLSFYFVYSLSRDYAEQETIQSLDTTLQLAKNLLEEDEHHALSLSLLLSQDRSFLHAYYHENRKKAFDILSRKINSINQLQGYTYDVQVHDANLNTYLRSWDFNITNVPLASFREGLVEVKKLKRPLVSIEVGKRLNIKAISPIIKNGEFQGSIEVIESFEHLRKKLSDQGAALFVLLDKKYLKIATTLKKHPLLSDTFVLVNNFYDANALNSLKNEDLTTLQTYGYFMQDKFSFGYFQIKNFKDDTVGYMVVAVQNSMSMNTQAYHETKGKEVKKFKTHSEVIIR